MTMSLAISTFAGAFIFPFLIRLLWGKFVDDWGAIGGWMAAGFIVGTTWCLNHGVGMIHQTGAAWIDMAFAAAAGLFVASCMGGDCLKKGSVDATFAIVGGILGGFILSTLA